MIEIVFYVGLVAIGVTICILLEMNWTTRRLEDERKKLQQRAEKERQRMKANQLTS